MTIVTLNKNSSIRSTIENIVTENGGDIIKDQLPITNLVEILSDIHVYQRTIKSEGEVIYDEKKGCSVSHPLTRNIREAQRLLPPLYECLGLNLRARNKIKGGTPQNDLDLSDFKGIL